MTRLRQCDISRAGVCGSVTTRMRSETVDDYVLLSQNYILVGFTLVADPTASTRPAVS